MFPAVVLAELSLAAGARRPCVRPSFRLDVGSDHGLVERTGPLVGVWNQPPPMLSLDPDTLSCDLEQSSSSH